MLSSVVPIKTSEMNFGFIQNNSGKLSIEDQKAEIKSFCNREHIALDRWEDKPDSLLDQVKAFDLALAFDLYAEVKKKLISTQTKKALSRCREDGISLGRPSGSQNKEYKLDKDRAIIQLMLSKGKSKAEICRKIGSSKNTLYRWLRQNDLM